MSETNSKRGIAKKIGRIALDVLLYLFLAICIFAVAVTVVSKKDADGTATVFGYQLRFVQSPSMEKSEETYDEIKKYDIKDIKTKELIIIETVPSDENKALKWYEKIEIGDVLTFKYVYAGKQETITHRVTDRREKFDKNGVLIGYVFDLKGDNKSATTEVLTQTVDTSESDAGNYIIGKVVGQSYAAGLLVYALKTPLGLICIIILPCAVIIVLEILRIVSVFGEEKRKKQKQESEEQKNEIEELKRKLAALEANRSDEEKGESKE